MLTKPLKGIKLKVMHVVLMNYSVDYNDEAEACTDTTINAEAQK